MPLKHIDGDIRLRVAEKQENLFQVSDALVITLTFGLVEARYLLKTHFYVFGSHRMIGQTLDWQ